MNKAQKIAILTEAIVLLEQRGSSLETYTRHYFEPYLRRCKAQGIAPTIEGFFEIVPEICQSPLSQLDNDYQDILDSFQQELAELTRPKKKKKG